MSGKPDAGFVAAMEDVLDVYARPIDPLRPLVCFDESGKALRGDVRPSQPAGPGHALREDPAYIRHGSANLFLWCAPHLGQRGITVTERRTRVDWAVAMRHLVDEVFPTAERIVVVLDNLNIHADHSLYAAFPPREAKRIRDKLELHYTPKHASWLNIAELEFSALVRQCLDQRIPTPTDLQQAVDAWTTRRNSRAKPVQWHFMVEHARIKLRRLYPVPELDTSC
ncbi:MAG: IS630 family transposase [Thermomicrobiales bacterium]